MLLYSAVYHVYEGRGEGSLFWNTQNETRQTKTKNQPPPAPPLRCGGPSAGLTFISVAVCNNSMFAKTKQNLSDPEKNQGRVHSKDVRIGPARTTHSGAIISVNTTISIKSRRAQYNPSSHARRLTYRQQYPGRGTRLFRNLTPKK